MNKLIVGECLNLDRATNCICTERKAYQNYICPYKNNYKKCKCYIAITETMKKQWETKGYISI